MALYLIWVATVTAWSQFAVSANQRCNGSPEALSGRRGGKSVFTQSRRKQGHQREVIPKGCQGRKHWRDTFCSLLRFSISQFHSFSFPFNFLGHISNPPSSESIFLLFYRCLQDRRTFLLDFGWLTFGPCLPGYPGNPGTPSFPWETATGQNSQNNKTVRKTRCTLFLLFSLSFPPSYLFSSRSKWTGLSVGTWSAFRTLGTVLSTRPNHAQLSLKDTESRSKHVHLNQLVSCLPESLVLSLLLLLSVLLFYFFHFISFCKLIPGLLWFPCHP